MNDQRLHDGDCDAQVAPSIALLSREPAYLIELHAPKRSCLWAIRLTLRAAYALAGTIPVTFAEVTIREVTLPCDAESLFRVLAEARVFHRNRAGAWSPSKP
ncbi:MAG: hypothetical protein NVS3B20_10860 [Polyangiales bacterium]